MALDGARNANALAWNNGSLEIQSSQVKIGIFIDHIEVYPRYKQDNLAFCILFGKRFHPDIVQ